MARYVRDSLDEVPGTDDHSNIKGALQPVALSTENIEDIDIKEEIEKTEDFHSVPAVKQDKERPLSVMLQFRDGDHSGEANLEEIIAGHDDGELSDRCLIYELTSESWVTIESFIAQDHSTSTENEDEPNVCEYGKDEEANAAEMISDDIPSIEIEPFEGFQPVSKNDRKKPKRDISAWGKGQVQPLTTKTEGNESTENGVSTSRRKKSKHIKPPAKLMRLCTQAMIQWDMLEDGDRLLLGLSGGKDSLSLLHVLLEFQKKLPVRFEIEVSQRFYVFCGIVHFQRI